MVSIKNLNRTGKVGFLIFLVINAALVLLLLSPILPNVIGKFMDDQILAGCDTRIQQYRTGPVYIKLQNASDGTPIEGWNISYDHIKHEFIFGCNIYGFDSFGTPGYNDLYKDRFKQLFEFATLGFYWTAYEPTEGSFPTEAKINATIAWCIQNNITTKGHPLTWTRSLPSWYESIDNETLQAEILENRIKTIVSKYEGLIDRWDVVNEPVHTAPLAGMSVFEYCQNSYLWGNASNPSAHLTINDYGIMGHDFGGGPFYKLVNNLIAAGTPIDAVGLQVHEPRTDWIPATEIWGTLEAYSKLGKPLHITEFEPTSSLTPITNSWKKGIWSEDNQAEYATRFYKMCFSHPAMKGIIWWDLSDAASWLEDGGLLGEDMTPKPVYTALDQLINYDWRTQGNQLSNSTGWVQFQGFYGKYNVSVQNGAYSFLRNAESGQENQFILEI